MTGNNVDLHGFVIDRPELRTMPNGWPILRFAIECGNAGEKLALNVMMPGGESRELAATLRPGQLVHVSGSLRAIMARGRLGVDITKLEVLARRIEAAAPRQNASNGAHQHDKTRADARTFVGNRNGGQ